MDIISESLPKPMMENLQPVGRLLIKILRASWAVSMRLKSYMLPLLSKRKMKCNSEAESYSVMPSSSPWSSSNSSWGAGGSKLGTKDAMQAMLFSPATVLLAKSKLGVSMSLQRQKKFTLRLLWLPLTLTIVPFSFESTIAACYGMLRFYILFYADTVKS